MEEERSTSANVEEEGTGDMTVLAIPGDVEREEAGGANAGHLATLPPSSTQQLHQPTSDLELTSKTIPDLDQQTSGRRSASSSISSLESPSNRDTAVDTESNPEIIDEETLDDSTMPHGGSRRPPFARRESREADLSGLLSPAQKRDLVQLVNAITDKMQQKISFIFDFPNDEDHEAKKDTNGKVWHLPLSQLNLNTDHLRSKNGDKNKENRNPAIANGGSSKMPPNSTADLKARETLCKEENEALSPKLQELKREALQAFKKWNNNVTKRVNDISVVPKGKPGTALAASSSSAPSSSAWGGRNNADKKFSVVEADAALMELYPPTSTGLCSLPMQKRVLILHTILLLLLSLEHYSAYSRILLLNLSSSLHIPLRVLAEDEVRVGKSLSEVAKGITTEDITRAKSDANKNSRRWKVGAAGVAGAALLGVTGGLAAPLVAAGLGTVLGGLGVGATATAGLLGSMAESSLVVGALFGIYGARQTGKMMDSYAKDVQDFAFLPLHGSINSEFREPMNVPPEDRRLKIVLGISGWLTQKEDIVNPWRALGHQSQVFALRWELEALMKMGNSLETVVKSAAWSVAKKEIITRTIFASLMEALWPVSLLKISKVIDNPWSIGMVRADKAGLILADSIMRKVQGERGVTLIGYSLGARVIYTCLMCLAERRAFGLVESVVMMGTPAASESRVWCALKSVVAGRLVNVYSENDYILGFLYRTSSIQYGVAGLQRIDGAVGVENVDVSDIVSGHMRYQYLVGSILKHLNWEDVNLKQVAQDEETLALMQEGEKKEGRENTKIGVKRDATQLKENVQMKTDNLESLFRKMKI